ANLGIGSSRLGVGSKMDKARAIGDYRKTVPPSNVDFSGATPVDANIKQQIFPTSSPPPDLPPSTLTLNNTEGLFSDLGFKTLPFTANRIASVGLALALLPNGN